MKWNIVIVSSLGKIYEKRSLKLLEMMGSWILIKVLEDFFKRKDKKDDKKNNSGPLFEEIEN